MSTNIYTSLSVYIYIYIYTYIHTYIYTYIHTYICSPYIYIYICIYTCVYIYIYIYISPLSKPRSWSLPPFPYRRCAEVAVMWTQKHGIAVVAKPAQLVKGRLSDAGGPRFESQAGRVTGESAPSLWRDRHPAIKGLRPPGHHAGKFHPDHEKTPPSQMTL